MSVQCKEREILIFPTIPSYKREFVEEVGKYLTWVYRYGMSVSFNFHELNSKQINILNKFNINEKRKTSSSGKKIIEYASKFLNEQINPEGLREAEKILSNGLKELENYEVSDESLAALHSLDGYVDVPFLGGRAPMKGELKEEKPSAYTSFKLSEEDVNKYLDLLGETLGESYNHLKEGFKSEENDKKFETLINSLLSGKEINLAQVKAVNDYVRRVYDDSSIIYKLADAFNEIRLNEFYKLPESKKSKILKEAGFKVIYPLTEKIGSWLSEGKSIGLSLLSIGIAGGVISIGVNIKNPHLIAIGFLGPGIAGPIFISEISDFYNKMIKSEKKILRKIEGYEKVI